MTLWPEGGPRCVQPRPEAPPPLRGVGLGRSSVSCPRLGVRASRVGPASLPASGRGIPAPCSQFRGGGTRAWKRAAGMPPELAGKDACPTPPARVPPQVSSRTAPVPAQGSRKLRCAGWPPWHRRKELRPPAASRPPARESHAEREFHAQCGITHRQVADRAGIIPDCGAILVRTPWHTECYFDAQHE